MEKQLECIIKEAKRNIIRYHGKRLTKHYGLSKPLTAKSIDKVELFNPEMSPAEELAYFIGSYHTARAISDRKKSISIDLTDADLQELLGGETFDRTYDGIDVHLYNSDSVDVSQGANGTD